MPSTFHPVKLLTGFNFCLKSWAGLSLIIVREKRYFVNFGSASMLYYTMMMMITSAILSAKNLLMRTVDAMDLRNSWITATFTSNIYWLIDCGIFLLNIVWNWNKSDLHHSLRNYNTEYNFLENILYTKLCGTGITGIYSENLQNNWLQVLNGFHFNMKYVYQLSHYLVFHTMTIPYDHFKTIIRKLCYPTLGFTEKKS